MFAAVKFSALSAYLPTVVYADTVLRVRARSDWVCCSLSAEENVLDHCYKGQELGENCVTNILICIDWMYIGKSKSEGNILLLTTREVKCT
jgi:hypothetical protein